MVKVANSDQATDGVMAISFGTVHSGNLNPTAETHC